LINPEYEELTEGATSITGFGFASQAGFDAAAAVVASTTNSSGEHEISLASPLGVVTSARV
jgi:hypothetical protein